MMVPLTALVLFFNGRPTSKFVHWKSDDTDELLENVLSVFKTGVVGDPSLLAAIFNHLFNFVWLMFLSKSVVLMMSSPYKPHSVFF